MDFWVKRKHQLIWTVFWLSIILSIFAKSWSNNGLWEYWTMSCDFVCINLECWIWFHHLLDLCNHLRPTSAAKCSSVLSLLEQGYSYCQIHNKTGISIGTIKKIGKEVDADKETILVAVPPSFLPVTSSPLSNKSTLGGLTMLFRLEISLIPFLHTLSILKLSEMHSKKLDFTLLPRRKFPCSS